VDVPRDGVYWLDPGHTAPSTRWAVSVSRQLDAERPKIQGKRAVGETLTAVPGKWERDDVRFGYTWLRNGKPFLNTSESTYKLTAKDQGKRISVEVEGSLNHYATTSMTSRATTPIKPAKLAADKPTISGKARVGTKLTAAPGSWSPDGVKFSYQWYRGTKKISGATKKSYTPTKADKGKALKVEVAGRKTGYVPVTRTTKPTKAVAPGTIYAPAHLSLSGRPAVGSTISVKTGVWKPSSVRLTYQWYRGTKKITGATKLKYTLKKADLGRTVKVVVKGTQAGYTSLKRTSHEWKVYAR
jgi:hypothetical protein